MAIPYELKRKNVKNIIIRLRRSDGNVMVTAPNRVPLKEIEQILQEKQEWIAFHQEKIRQHERERQKWFEGRDLPSDAEIMAAIEAMIISFREDLKPWGIDGPEKVRLRTMKTLWGSCHPAKKVITINRILLLAPRDCQEYVVLHELAHLAYPNHGADFYRLLDQVQPDHRRRRKRLKDLALL